MTSTTLPPPLVVDPTTPHTHTIVFLHRFPSPLPSDLTPRILSSKRPRNHRPLATQFPSIRWVFPFHKPPPAARPYANLTPADRAAVGLDARTTSPYITQLVLQEARRLDGLHRVILGGQGDTAEAAHETLLAFPDVLPDGMTEDEPRLAGFVGMHADAREQTRDVKAYAVTTKMEEGDERRPGRVGRGVVCRTPHRFIHGGYKVQTQTWDGKRIDEMAKFLEEEMGVERLPTEEQRKLGKETLTPKDREKKPEEVKETLTEGQKYALELAKEKKANEELAEKIKIRIEADKVERKIRLERERRKRAAAAGMEEGDDLAHETAVPTIKDEPEASTANLTGAQKAALEIAREKKANKALADRTRQRIEADKVERKIKQERELERRRAAENAPPAPKEQEHDDYDDYDEYSAQSARSNSEEMWDAWDSTLAANNAKARSPPSPAEGGRLPKRRAKKQAPGRVASEGQPWQGGSRARGEMTDAQMRALGLVEEAKVKEEDI